MLRAPISWGPHIISYEWEHWFATGNSGKGKEEPNQLPELLLSQRSICDKQGLAVAPCIYLQGRLANLFFHNDIFNFICKYVFTYICEIRMRKKIRGLPKVIRILVYMKTIETHQSKDGLIRVRNVGTENGHFQRPVVTVNSSPAKISSWREVVERLYSGLKLCFFFFYSLWRRDPRGHLIIRSWSVTLFRSCKIVAVFRSLYFMFIVTTPASLKYL